MLCMQVLQIYQLQNIIIIEKIKYSLARHALPAIVLRAKIDPKVTTTRAEESRRVTHEGQRHLAAKMKRRPETPEG